MMEPIVLDAEIQPKQVSLNFSSSPTVLYSDGTNVCGLFIDGSTRTVKRIGCLNIGNVQTIGIIGDKPAVVTPTHILIFSKKLRLARKLRLKRTPKLVVFYRDGFIALFPDKACFKYVTKNEKVVCIDGQVPEIKTFAKYETKKGIIGIDENKRLVNIDFQYRVISRLNKTGELVAINGRNIAIYNEGIIEVGMLPGTYTKEATYGFIRPLFAMPVYFKPKMLFLMHYPIVVTSNSVVILGEEQKFTTDEPIISGYKGGKNLIVGTKKHLYLFFGLRGKMSLAIRH